MFDLRDTLDTEHVEISILREKGLTGKWESQERGPARVLFGCFPPGSPNLYPFFAPKRKSRSRNSSIFSTPFWKTNNAHNLTMRNTRCNSLLVNVSNHIFKSNLFLNNFKWLLTKLELWCMRSKSYTLFQETSLKRIPRSQSGAPTSRPLRAMHTCTENVVEYYPFFGRGGGGSAII